MSALPPGSTKPLRSLAEEAISTWRRGAPADAYQLLVRQPSLLSDRSCVLDLALEEYSLRRSRGEHLGPTTFRERFESFGTDLAASIGRLVAVEDLVNQHDLSWPELVWPNEGDRLHDDFEVLEEVGRGGLARVYLCRQLSVGERLVVVKLSRLSTDEASCLGQCEHPNIAPIHGVSKLAGGQGSAICMPYQGKVTLSHLIASTVGKGIACDGSSLRTVLVANEHPGRPLVSESSGRGIYAQDERSLRRSLLGGITAGLACAHSAGVVHGDVKPSNVLVTELGSVLIDFNLSRTDTIEQRVLGGTLPYLPPELWQALPGLEGSTLLGCGSSGDVFSFGMTAAEMICGEQPPITDDQGELTERTADQAYAVQRSYALATYDRLSGSDDRLRDLLITCVQKDPSKRPSAAELASELASDSKPEPWRNATQPRIGRRALIAGGIAVTALAVISRPRASNSYRLGTRLLSEGDNEAAIAALTQQLQHDPSHFETRYALAWALIRCSRFEEAFAELKTLRTIRLDDHVRATCGYCAAASQRYDSAIVWYESIRADLISTAAVMNNLACSLWLGRSDRPREMQINQARTLFKLTLDARRETSQVALANLINLESALLISDRELADRDYALFAVEKATAEACSDTDRLARLRLRCLLGTDDDVRLAREGLEELLSRGLAPSLSAWLSDPAYGCLRSDRKLDRWVRIASGRIPQPPLVFIEHRVIYPSIPNATESA